MLINAQHAIWVLWKKKWSHFNLKSWVTGETKIRPWIPSKWRIFESNWLSSLTRYWESIWLKYSPKLLGIQERILVSQVTQLFRSKWPRFFFLGSYATCAPIVLPNNFLSAIMALIGKTRSALSKQTSLNWQLSTNRMHNKSMLKCLVIVIVMGASMWKLMRYINFKIIYRWKEIVCT